MPFFGIVPILLDTPYIKFTYEANTPDRSFMNGLFADVSRYEHVLIPTDINPSVATVVRSQTGYTVVLCEKKKQEKIQQGWEELRRLRNDKLSAIDYMFLTDYSISDQDKEQWRAYRQALRDLPSTLTDEAILYPDTITWPAKPQ